MSHDINSVVSSPETLKIGTTVWMISQLSRKFHENLLVSFCRQTNWGKNVAIMQPMVSGGTKHQPLDTAGQKICIKHITR